MRSGRGHAYLSNNRESGAHHVRRNESSCISNLERVLGPPLRSAVAATCSICVRVQSGTHSSQESLRDTYQGYKEVTRIPLRPNTCVVMLLLSTILSKAHLLI